MRTDRRGFMRVLAGAIGLLAGGSSSGSSRDWTHEIHRATRNTRFGPVGALRPRLPRASRRSKAFAGAPRIPLPAPEAPQARALAQVLSDFSGANGLAAAPLTLAELTRLLHYTNGVTGGWGAGDGLKLRAASGSKRASTTTPLCDTTSCRSNGARGSPRCGTRSSARRRWRTHPQRFS
jgi:hypothetical protein